MISQNESYAWIARVLLTLTCTVFVHFIVSAHYFLYGMACATCVIPAVRVEEQ